MKELTEKIKPHNGSSYVQPTGATFMMTLHGIKNISPKVYKN